MCACRMTEERLGIVASRKYFRHIAGSFGEMCRMVTDRDDALLGLLKLNAREPIAVLARKLGVSRTTIQDRLKRLEESGVVAGYSLRLGKAAKAPGIAAFVTIYVEPRQATEVGKAVALVPQVETLHTVSGKFDLIALVRSQTSEDMDLVLDKISAITGVTDIETAVILSTKVDRK
jgi:DNA-binding Lrp family transcriptional regulator